MCRGRSSPHFSLRAAMSSGVASPMGSITDVGSPVMLDSMKTMMLTSSTAIMACPTRKMMNRCIVASRFTYRVTKGMVKGARRGE